MFLICFSGTAAQELWLCSDKCQPALIFVWVYHHSQRWVHAIGNPVVIYVVVRGFNRCSTRYETVLKCICRIKEAVYVANLTFGSSKLLTLLLSARSVGLHFYTGTDKISPLTYILVGFLEFILGKCYKYSIWQPFLSILTYWCSCFR